MGRRLFCMALVLLLALGLVACGHQSAPSTGVYGLAVRDLSRTNPSASPLPDGFGYAVWQTPAPRATITVRSADGTVVTRLVAGADGTFRVALPPGSYYLQGEKLPKFFWTSIPLKPGVWARLLVTTRPS